MTKWELPPLPKGSNKEYLPIVRVGRVVPFGYKETDDPDILDPVPLELEALGKAKLLVKEYSFRAVAEWLSTQTGRKISHVGLKKRIESEARRQREAETSRFYAKKYKEAQEKAEKLEAKLGGAATYVS